MNALLSVATALAIIAGSTAAFADSGDAPQTSQPQVMANETITAALLASEVGNEAQAADDRFPDPQAGPAS